MSKYLKALIHASETGQETFKLMSDCIIVEIIKDEELKTKSGIILASGNKTQINGIDANKPLWGRVLMVGEGYYEIDEEGNKRDVKLETVPGDIVLLGKQSVEYFSVFGKLPNYGETQLGLTREGEVRMRFKGQEGFDKFFELANSQLTG